MRRMGELMEELGFNKDAPDSVKKAFIKNLIKNAYGAPVEDLRPRKKKVSKRVAGDQTSNNKVTKDQQLSFLMEDSDKDIA